MKRLSILMGIIFFIAACSAPIPVTPTAAPEPTPAPTATPDPCSKENILAEVEELQISVNEFREVAELANNVDVRVMVSPLLRLQEIRFEIIKTKVPVCLDLFKAASTNYTASVINYIMVFMSVKDPNNIQTEESENLNSSIQNSQTQWQILLNEFNNVLAVAGLEPQPVTDSSSIAPTPTGGAVIATNESTLTVNVHANPDLTAEVVASMENGTQAEVIGRNEASDWLQVKLNDITGWVLAETVTIEIPVDQLTVVEVIP
jgi:hypothetical protein